jgi:hypothetical protein
MRNLMTPINVEAFEMVRNAKVEVTKRVVGLTESGLPIPEAEIVVNDRYTHTFPNRSRISQALLTMPPEALAARLSGGDFFFINGQLVDFRDGQYEQSGGFVHTDESINKMIELIGVRFMKSNDKRALGIKTHGGVALSGVYNTQEIVIPKYLAGGDFQANLMYNWNPFHNDIKGVFELVRVICLNGMVGVCDEMNTRIPLVNRWEENLDIAARQIQNKIGARVMHRLELMDQERATVGECQQLSEHAAKRLAQAENLTDGEYSLLQRVYSVVTPALHLAKFYKKNVFGNRDIGAQMPSHLSRMTAFNAATELYTHTPETDASTGRALQMYANNMLFSLKNKGSKLLDGLKRNVLGSPFNDPSKAFVGEIKED